MNCNQNIIIIIYQLIFLNIYSQNTFNTGKPDCLGKTVGIAQTDGSITLQVDVYSSSKITCNLMDSEEDLPVKQSPKHKVTITESQTMVEMYNHQVRLNSTKIILGISDVDQQDARSYRFEVSNRQGTSYCTVILPERRKCIHIDML